MMYYILNIWVVEKYNANDHSSSQINITIKIIRNAFCYVLCMTNFFTLGIKITPFQT